MQQPLFQDPIPVLLKADVITCTGEFLELFAKKEVTNALKCQSNYVTTY